MSTISSSDDQSACGLVLTGNLKPKAQALENLCQFFVFDELDLVGSGCYRVEGRGRVLSFSAVVKASQWICKILERNRHFTCISDRLLMIYCCV